MSYLNEGIAGVKILPLVSMVIAVLEFVASCMVFTLSIDAIVYPTKKPEKFVVLFIPAMDKLLLATAI